MPLEFPTYGEFVQDAHARATTSGPEKPESASVVRKRSLIEKVARAMFPDLSLGTDIAGMKPGDRVKLFQLSYALAMQLLLEKCDRKKEPQRKPDIVLSDMDAYSYSDHRILMNGSGKPYSIFPRMIEETAHSFRVRLYSPPKNENMFMGKIAQEFCAMIARRSAYENLSTRSGDRLGLDNGWTENNDSVETELNRIDRKLMFPHLRQRGEETASLVADKNEILAHHIGYSCAQAADMRRLPPLDKLFSMPSEELAKRYMQEWMKGAGLME